jgi:hypothetical protein
MSPRGGGAHSESLSPLFEIDHEIDHEILEFENIIEIDCEFPPDSGSSPEGFHTYLVDVSNLF